MLPWLPIFVAVAMVVAIVGWLLRPNDRPADDDQPMLSIVALLKQPRYLEPIILATAAKNAWGAELSVRDEEDEGDDEEPAGDGFVVGESPASIILYQGRGILVNSFPRPYVEDPEEQASSIADLRLRELFTQHSAWMSCDALGVESPDDPDEARDWYRLLGRLMAELLDDDCLAIFIPQANQLFPNMEETWEMLRSEDPLETLHGDSPVPIIEIPPDDPRMVAAVNQARSTWGDFVAAFEQRDGEQFGVKAPISREDNTEFIWLTVEAIENDVIYGRLANEPMALGNLKIGSQVRTPLSELNDWAYIGQDGEPRGLFTVKVLAEAEQQRQQGLDNE